MKEPKIKIPFEVSVCGTVDLKEYGNLVFQGYYGDFIQLLYSLDDKFGIDNYSVSIEYEEHF